MSGRGCWCLPPRCSLPTYSCGGVTIGFEWVPLLLGWISVHVFRQQPADVPDQRLARLRSRKQAIGSQIETRRASHPLRPGRR